MRKKHELDEMEQAILAKSMTCAYKFMIIVLSLWVVIGLFLKQSVVLPGYVLLGQLLVRFVAEQIYKREVEDERWKRNVVFFLIGVAVMLFVALLIPLLFIGTGEMR